MAFVMVDDDRGAYGQYVGILEVFVPRITLQASRSLLLLDQRLSSILWRFHGQGGVTAFMNMEKKCNPSQIPTEPASSHGLIFICIRESFETEVRAACITVGESVVHIQTKMRSCTPGVEHPIWGKCSTFSMNRRITLPISADIHQRERRYYVLKKNGNAQGYCPNAIDCAGFKSIVHNTYDPVVPSADRVVKTNMRCCTPDAQHPTGWAHMSGSSVQRCSKEFKILD
ncbi:hypothetical protein B0H19DRAFT_1082593 [Mycena capillaripes]|nr:hypothetical protein B0H19DRAFT_1082593 [Mycena capillaripes]